MDRFIVFPLLINIFPGYTFKIQYGQIYSTLDKFEIEDLRDLKSNMDRFIDENL